MAEISIFAERKRFAEIIFLMLPKFDERLKTPCCKLGSITRHQKIKRFVLNNSDSVVGPLRYVYYCAKIRTYLTLP